MNPIFIIKVILFPACLVFNTLILDLPIPLEDGIIFSLLYAIGCFMLWHRDTDIEVERKEVFDRNPGLEKYWWLKTYPPQMLLTYFIATLASYLTNGEILMYIIIVGFHSLVDYMHKLNVEESYEKFGALEDYNRIYKKK